MLIHDYNYRWPADFAAIAAVLTDALGPTALRVEHVGSTAVPGLAAKAIIDIDVVYPVDGDLAEIVDRLAGLGYHHNGDQGIPRREVFKRDPDADRHAVLDAITHHLYACPADSPELARHLAFRDALRADAAARSEYGRLKRAIAADAGEDKSGYAALKEVAATAFVERILSR